MNENYPSDWPCVFCRHSKKEHYKPLDPTIDVEYMSFCHTCERNKDSKWCSFYKPMDNLTVIEQLVTQKELLK